MMDHGHEEPEEFGPNDKCGCCRHYGTQHFHIWPWDTSCAMGGCNCKAFC